jgi:hypothetical protein
VLNVRKLAAIDLEFLGARFILAEFGIGVTGPIALGVLTLRAGLYRFHSLRMIVFGVYLLALGINYVPLLWHAIDMVHGGSAHAEIAGELGDKRAVLRKYRRQSLFLLVPFFAPVVGIVQNLQRRRPILAKQ